MSKTHISFLMSLILTCILSPSTHASDLVAMQFSDGWYLFGTSHNGVIHQKLQHNYVQNIQVENHLAYVQAMDGHYLYGLTTAGFTSRRLDETFVQGMSLGEDVAVVQSFGLTRVYALAQQGIVHADVARGRPSTIRVSGRLVFLGFGQQHLLIGATPAGLVSLNVNGFPSGLELVRDTAVVRYSVGGTYVVGLTDMGFSHTQVSNGTPAAIRLPRSTSTEGRELSFEALHEGHLPAPVEVLLKPEASIGAE